MYTCSDELIILTTLSNSPTLTNLKRMRVPRGLIFRFTEMDESCLGLTFKPTNPAFIHISFVSTFWSV